MVKAVGRFMAVRDITVFLLLRTEQRMQTVWYWWEVKNRDLLKLRRQRQQLLQKAIGLVSKTTTLHVHHALLYISLPPVREPLQREMTKC